MMISHQHKTVFVSMPKAGTHSLYEILPRWGFERYGGYHERFLPRKVRRYAVFTTCRHPIDRLVASWFSLMFHTEHRDRFLEVIGGDTLSAFLRYVITLPNHRQLRGPGYMVIAPQMSRVKHLKFSAILRMEALEEDLQRLPFVGESVRVPHVLARPHPPWQDLVSPELLDPLVKWLEPDFRQLPYARPAPIRKTA